MSFVIFYWKVRFKLSASNVAIGCLFSFAGMVLSIEFYRGKTQRVIFPTICRTSLQIPKSTVHFDKSAWAFSPVNASYQMAAILLKPI